MSVSTIQLDKKVIRQIQQAREYPRQTYNELLEKMTKTFLAVRQNSQYDKFLHQIQQPKMKELWDNSADEAWRDA